jgi:hypothetical protein
MATFAQKMWNDTVVLSSDFFPFCSAIITWHYLNLRYGQSKIELV